MLISNIFAHFEPKGKIHNITFFCPEALFNASSVRCSNVPLKGSSNPLHNYVTFKRQSFIRPASTKGVEYERVWEHLQLQINPGGYNTALAISKECKLTLRRNVRCGRSRMQIICKVKRINHAPGASRFPLCQRPLLSAAVNWYKTPPCIFIAGNWKESTFTTAVPGVSPLYRWQNASCCDTLAAFCLLYLIIGAVWSLSFHFYCNTVPKYSKDWFVP